ncbi:MAG: hypothetical protein KF778_05615 [Rhodocyclaceae bacterium]|nr:hypothetical protein [Rhodocyclaceae bacterium]MBX3667861.1 hypothetical protein [Rhodocyclaceae bacterium]
MNKPVLATTFLIGWAVALQGAWQTAAAAEFLAFQPVPELQKKLDELGEHSGLMLGKVHVEPADVGRYHAALSNGPGRRDYSNKLAYAPDRGTALYAGGNHGSPHRLNDVWEFHLASNTWRMICPPGHDTTRLVEMLKVERRLNEAIAQGAEVTQNQAALVQVETHIRDWYNNVDVSRGYLEDSTNGGPLMPSHTWDGITYDEARRRLYWAVLDSDNYAEERLRVQRERTRRYAQIAGLDERATLAQLKPGSSMYWYDLAKGRWGRQLGEGPLPIMRAPGGTLVYLPDKKLTLWYAYAGSTNQGYVEGMWAYDAAGNRWKNLIPGEVVSSLARQQKAPAEEIQSAYSVKHGRIVVVNREKTFVYDVAANSWRRVADNPGYGEESYSVFAYDSNADVFLLVSKKGGKSSTDPWFIAAYSIDRDNWVSVDIKGDPLAAEPLGRAWQWAQYAGYYDAGQNALVLYNGRDGTTYVYRHMARIKPHS